MIELVNVSKYYPTEFGRHYVFRNVNLTLPLDLNVAVIGPNGAGKSTFLRMLGGADPPSDGRILKTGSISPPMGLTPGLQGSMTGSENTRFACRIYGMTRDEANETVERVRELADIGKFFDMPVRTYSAGMKQRVAFALSMSMHFDYYLFDEISAGGDRAFRKTSKRLIQERLSTSNFIIATHRTDEMLELCQACILIRDGELTYFDDMREAIDAYGVDDEDEKTAARIAAMKNRRPSGIAAPLAAADEPKAPAPPLRKAKANVVVSPEQERQRAATRAARIHAAEAAAKSMAEKMVPRRAATAAPVQRTKPATALVPAPRAKVRKAAQLQISAAAKAARAHRLLLRLIGGESANRSLVRAASNAQLQAAEAAAETLNGLLHLSGPRIGAATLRPRAAATPEDAASTRAVEPAADPAPAAAQDHRRKRLDLLTSTH